MKNSKYPVDFSPESCQQLAEEFALTYEQVITIHRGVCVDKNNEWIGTQVPIQYDPFRFERVNNIESHQLAHPEDQLGQWTLYDSACKINKNEANNSASFGIGMVPGSEYKKAGYVSVEIMIAYFGESSVEQLAALLRLLQTRKRIWNAIKENHWDEVATHYYGLGPQRIQGGRKLAAIYKQERYQREPLFANQKKPAKDEITTG